MEQAISADLPPISRDLAASCAAQLEWLQSFISSAAKDDDASLVASISAAWLDSGAWAAYLFWSCVSPAPQEQPAPTNPDPNPPPSTRDPSPSRLRCVSLGVMGFLSLGMVGPLVFGGHGRRGHGHQGVLVLVVVVGIARTFFMIYAQVTPPLPPPLSPDA